MNFGVCDLTLLAVTDWRLRRWRLWFLALSNAPRVVTQENFLVIRNHFYGSFVQNNFWINHACADKMRRIRVECEENRLLKL